MISLLLVDTADEQTSDNKNGIDKSLTYETQGLNILYLHGYIHIKYFCANPNFHMCLIPNNCGNMEPNLTALSIKQQGSF